MTEFHSGPFHKKVTIPVKTRPERVINFTDFQLEIDEAEE